MNITNKGLIHLEHTQFFEQYYTDICGMPKYWIFIIYGWVFQKLSEESIKSLTLEQENNSLNLKLHQLQSEMDEVESRKFC